VPILLVKVTRAQEVATAVEAAHVTSELAIETSAWEAIAAWDNVAIHVEDVEGRVALAERQALERVSRVEVETAATLAIAHEDAKGFARKIALLDDDLTVERQARKVSERERRECLRSSPFC
jgi:hypothetical protein